MEPDYREGDIVIFSPLLPTPSGADCFVRFERDAHTTFKRIYVEDGGRAIRLQPLNNAYGPQVVDREESPACTPRVTSCGRSIAKCRRYLPFCTRR